MKLDKKHLVAILALGAVSMVWVPRFTGWDPMGLYAAASPVDTGSGAGGQAEWPSADSEAMAIDPLTGEALGGGTASGPGPTGAGATSPVGELGSVLAFLESRDRVGAPSVEVRGGPPRAVPSGATSTNHEVVSTLEGFLAFHPLSAIAVGSRRSCALFGRTSVRTGDELLDGRIVVHAIERDGVVLDTDQGRVKVPLPTPGQLRANTRSEGSSTATDQD